MYNMFALLNGASVYLTIPLLDTLFQEGSSVKTETTTQLADKATTALRAGSIN